MVRIVENLTCYFFQDKKFKQEKNTEKVLVFDIDATLYPYNTDLHTEIRNGLRTLIKKSNIRDHDKLFAMLTTAYKSLLRGILETFIVDKEEILKTVYNFDYDKYFQHNYELKEFLDSLPYKKILMTNGMEEHAIKVLKGLGIISCFDILISPSFTDSKCVFKPMEESYHVIEKIFNLKDKKNYLFFDDKNVNIEGAISCGWSAWLVDTTKNINEHVSAAIEKYF